MEDDFKLIAALFAIVLRDLDLRQIDDALKTVSGANSSAAPVFRAAIERVLRERDSGKLSV